jgi:hypothetical protein
VNPSRKKKGHVIRIFGQHPYLEYCDKQILSCKNISKFVMGSDLAKLSFVITMWHFTRSCDTSVLLFSNNSYQTSHPPLLPEPIHPSKMSNPHLPLDLWYEVFGLLDIDEAIAVSKASPRVFGEFIESKQGIRFRNAINSYMRSNAVYLPVGPLSSFVCSVSSNSSLEFSSLVSWLAIRFRPVLSSNIVVNKQLFKALSSTIALNDRGFVSVSSIVNHWTVEMKAKDGSVSSVSWILLYRASLSEYRAADFHHACDGMGKCVVFVKAENGRIAAAYNEHGFTSVNSSRSPTSMAFSSLLARMVGVERYSIGVIVD